MPWDRDRDRDRETDGDQDHMHGALQLQDHGVDDGDADDDAEGAPFQIRQQKKMTEKQQQEDPTLFPQLEGSEEEEVAVVPESKDDDGDDSCGRGLCVGLVVGNYCHDVLFRGGHVIGEGLGGATSFVSSVFRSVGEFRCRYVSKVGPDFRYAVPDPPILSSSSSPTTLFHAYFNDDHQGGGGVGDGGYHGDRVLKRIAACDPIRPSDLPSSAAATSDIFSPSPSFQFQFGLAVGVAGEILPETLVRMLDLCRLVFVDAQALIRTFDPADGTVYLSPLRETPFFHLLPRITFLKASADEAEFVDIQEVRKWCCIVVTHGKDGCTLYWKDGHFQIPTFPAAQVDPTGAGDSFLGGFVAGLVQGLSVPDAALLGNFFGSLTVRQIGVPKFHPPTMQAVRDKLIEVSRFPQCWRDSPDYFRKSRKHYEFLEFLVKSCNNSLEGDGR